MNGARIVGHALNPRSERMNRTSLGRSVCASFAFVLLLLPLPAQARTLAAIKAAGILRVGLTGDYPPYALRDTDGRITGADVVMAQALAKELGVRLEIVSTTWKSLTNDFQARRFDIAMGGVSVTPERAAIADFSITLVADGKRPIARCVDKDRYSSIAAINQPDVRVVFNPGGTNEAFAKAHFPDAKLEEYRDNRTIFDEIAASRADVMVTDGVEVDYQAKRHPGVLCRAAVPNAFNHFEKAYWMTRDPALKSAVDAVVGKRLDNGDYLKALAAPW
jgi:cyclohexadienyl dehydratase